MDSVKWCCYSWLMHSNVYMANILFLYVKFVFGTKFNDAMILVPMNYSARTSICLLYCIRDSSDSNSLF